MAKDKDDKVLDLEEMGKIIDMTTGLTLLQKKAAELSALGKSDPEIAKAIGKHFNTVKNWRAKYAAFRDIENNYRPQSSTPLIIPPMTTGDIDNPEAICSYTTEAIILRMAILIPRALETMDNLLTHAETPASVKLATAKYISSHVYQELKPMVGQSNEYLEELKVAIARANGQNVSLAK